MGLNHAVISADVGTELIRSLDSERLAKVVMIVGWSGISNPSTQLGARSVTVIGQI